MPINWSGLGNFVTTMLPIIIAFIKGIPAAGGTVSAKFGDHKDPLKASLLDAGVLEADAMKAIAWAEANWSTISADATSVEKLFASLEQLFTTAA